MKVFKRLQYFLKYNHHKCLTIQALYYCGVYRLCILLIPMKKLERFFGKAGLETDFKEDIMQSSYVRNVAQVVNRVSSKTPWESKCLLRALTIRRILSRHKIPTTLYLGVMKQEEELRAHAWIRCGSFYLSGGDGEGYAKVATYGTQYEM